MSSGVADWERVIRPRYGAAHSEIGVVLVVAGEETELLSVSGKGVIYGGALHLTYDSDQENSIPILEVDGANIAEINFFTINLYNLSIPGSYPFYIRHYDLVTPRFAVGISGGMTFEMGFRILYSEKHDTTPYVVCRAIYALI